MKTEYYEILDLSKLNTFREKMIEVIFKSRHLDGQKGKKTYGTISQEMVAVSLKKTQLINQYLEDCQKFNIHPDVLRVSFLLETTFWPFDIIPTNPQYSKIFFEKDNTPLTGIINSGEYIEKERLEQFIKNWYNFVQQPYPKKQKKVSLFYNFDLGFILKDIITKHKVSDINFYKNAKIYQYRKNKKSHTKRFLKLKDKFLAKYNHYDKIMDMLSEEEQFSDRGAIHIDGQNVYKLNGIDTFEYHSAHFWELHNEFLSLQSIKPEIFGEGYARILQELHKIFLNKYPHTTYWKDYEKFLLKIQQQYIYIANEDKSLRIDLFRYLEENGEFQGGVWHSLQHFTRNGTPLSAKFKGGPEFYESYFFNSIKEAFFFTQWEEKKEKKKPNPNHKIFESKQKELGEPKKLRLTAFFYDSEKKLHYLNSVIVK